MADHTMKIHNHGEEIKVKMTFGLLHELAGLVGDLEVIPEIAYTKDLREAILVSALSPRDEDGEIEKPIKVKTIDSDPKEIEELLLWVGEHVADFLVNSLTRVHETMKERTDKLEGLTFTSNGGAT